MLRYVTAVLAIFLISSFSVSYCQSTSSKDNFLPSAYDNSDKLLDENNLFYQTIEDEQNYHIGSSYYKRRDAYLRRGFTNLRSLKTASNKFEHFLLCIFLLKNFRLYVTFSKNNYKTLP